MWFREITDTSLFEAKRGAFSPIKLLSNDDVDGAQFDHVFVLGLTADVMPGQPKLNSLIPSWIQVAAGCPGSSPELKLSEGKLTLKTMKSVARRSVVTSYAGVNSRGVCQSPTSMEKFEDASDAKTRTMKSIALTVTPDAALLPVAPDELQGIRGGTSILKNQAAQPFYSFARNRLGIKPFPQNRFGLDARLQGIAVHDSLEAFWNETQDSQTLNAMCDQKLREAISKATQYAFDQSSELAEHRVGRMMRSLEIRRVEHLLLDWLMLEKERSYPFKVEATELEVVTTCEGIPMTLRIDRIDEVMVSPTEIKRVVSDYKTGKNIVMSDLNAEGMKEPQLPLYATLLQDGKPVDGVSISQINPDKIASHLRSDFTNSLVGKRTSSADVGSPEAWAAQVTSWKSSIRELSEGFKSGNYDFDYSQVKAAVGYDDLAPLIRVGLEQNVTFQTALPAQTQAVIVGACSDSTREADYVS